MWPWLPHRGSQGRSRSRLPGMARWQIQVTIDGHDHALVVDAETDDAAVARLEGDRAAARGDRMRRHFYDTPAGRIDVYWGRAAVVDVGAVTAAV